jgi:hypothetical protein
MTDPPWARHDLREVRHEGSNALAGARRALDDRVEVVERELGWKVR